MDLLDDIANCTLCAARFAATRTAHAPRPVLRAVPGARVLIAGQAPGARVHASGLPFDDPSGDRLRDWMGVTRETFYDTTRIAIVPMAFCFPGYSAKGADLPPPPLCAATWRARVLATLPDIRCTLVVGGYAQKWHLSADNVTDTVVGWRSHAPTLYPLPHPSWRNTAWLKRQPWFETDLVPNLRHHLSEVLT
jgi:uracil-DNA glycosylase